ncbi:MAG: PTS transporter subunit EIIC, partial [Bacillota bacterium]
PGPGLGLLCAYWIFGKGTAKQSAPGAVVIHFLGGIHEIYFPYVLMKPLTILGVIAGGMSGVFTFVLLKAGLVATPSPGSIFAELAMTPKGGHFAVISGILVAAVVSFLVNGAIIKASKD